MWKHQNNNVGEFVEADCGHTFTYRKTTDPWAIKNGLDMEVDVGYDTRFARVTNTRCYMAIDEKVDGSPFIETWKFKKHTVYMKGV
jgi:hypothetical protein